MSIGNGNTIVEFFSVDIVFNVYEKWRMQVKCEITTFNFAETIAASSINKRGRCIN